MMSDDGENHSLLPVNATIACTSAIPSLYVSPKTNPHVVATQISSRCCTNEHSCKQLKILSFNINGIKSICEHYGGLQNLLQTLDADIVCFQETKATRASMTHNLAVVSGYHGFFSFCRTARSSGKAYSGTATFIKHKIVPVLAAQDGLTGLLKNHGNDIVAARGGNLCSAHQFKKSQKQTQPSSNMVLNRGIDDNSASAKDVKKDVKRIDEQKNILQDWSENELRIIDREGRCVVTDHGLFVLLNVYAPAYSEVDGRSEFKKRYHTLILDAVRQLHMAGRRVVLLGDLNCAASPIDRDYCSSGGSFARNKTHAEVAADYFLDSYCSQWLQTLIDPRCADEMSPFLTLANHWKHRDKLTKAKKKRGYYHRRRPSG